MKKSQIQFYAFVILFVITIPLSFDKFSLDYATSVVPGWHTTINPPYFIINVVVSLIFFSDNNSLLEAFAESENIEVDIIFYSSRIGNSCGSIYCTNIFRRKSTYQLNSTK